MMPPLSRDRLLAFAFAPAELLAALGPDHAIAWAAGAYPARFGCPAEAMLGRPATDLLAPEYHETLDAALRTVARVGRVPPTAVRLADAARSRFALSALSLPGPEPTLCVSLGPLPLPAPPPASAPRTTRTGRGRGPPRPRQNRVGEHGERGEALAALAE